MAAIAETRVEVFDTGSGVGVKCTVTVTVGAEVFTHTMTLADLALTAPQVTSLQNAVDVLRNKAIAKTRTDLTIP